MIIWLARAMTSAQCCQSSRLGTVVVGVVGHGHLIPVIASGAKQSMLLDANGLLRHFVPRNDGSAMTPPQLLPDALVLLDYVGIAVFAVSGALLAAEKKQTLVTFIFFAVVTGVGGGTDARPADRRAGVLGAHQRHAADLHRRGARRLVPVAPGHRRARRLLWFDAIGLAAYATYGAAKALNYGVAPVPAFAMGVMTACVGGIIRDVLANEPSILMRPELYVTAAALASGLFVVLALFGAPPALAALVAGLAGFSLRGAAIARGLSPAGLRQITQSTACRTAASSAMLTP